MLTSRSGISRFIWSLFRIACSCFFIIALSGCSYLPWFNEKDPVADAGDQQEDKAKVGANNKNNLKNTADEEQELKLAKLWSRVDEMEEEQFRQKEKIRLLEKGLTLGLVPEELKQEGQQSKRARSSHPDSEGVNDKSKKPSVKDSKKISKSETSEKTKGADGNTEADKHKDERQDRQEDKHSAEVDLSKELENSGETVNKDGNATNQDGDLSAEETERYQKMLALAQEQLRAGRYARAAVEFSAIDKNFGGRIKSGIHLYFLAQCWANLKEYGTARTHYTDFMKSYPSSPWVPRAKVELARVELQLGMRETAAERLSRVVRDYPYEDAAELARMELDRLKKTL